MPTNPNILFAHHFSAIAGAGPIVGPTLAVLYGYLPVWLWVIVGGVLIGAVHDFSTLFVSLREKGRSMAEIARGTLGMHGFALFIGFAAVMIILVTSAFLKMAAMSLTSMVPLPLLNLPADQRILHTVSTTDPVTGAAVTKGVIGGIASTSVVIITLCAPLLGWLLFRRRLHTAVGYLLAIVVCFGSILVGLRYPVSLDPNLWMVIISVYVLFAAGVPVWLILQPRDFINVQILYAGILAMVVALFVGGAQGMTLEMPVLAVREGAQTAGALWPMLFITVACGAISGFHALVATGTTAKQLARESHARVIGYNGMLLESVLAIAALLVICAALPRAEYLNIVYPSDMAKSNPILAFSLALGTMLQKTVNFPSVYGTVFGILLLEGFVITTLDAAVRLNRYLFEELWSILWRGRVPAVLRLPWFNSLLAVSLMFVLAWSNGFTLLWPLFATGNQMLAALSLIAISTWLLARRRQSLFTLIPALFMIATTLASLLLQLQKFVGKLADASLGQQAKVGTGILLGVDILLLILSVGVVLLAVHAIARCRTGLPRAETPEPVEV